MVLNVQQWVVLQNGLVPHLANVVGEETLRQKPKTESDVAEPDDALIEEHIGNDADEEGVK
jgi:hypothetical protein